MIAVPIEVTPNSDTCFSFLTTSNKVVEAVICGVAATAAQIHRFINQLQHEHATVITVTMATQASTEMRPPD